VTLAVVSVLYLGVAVTTIAALGRDAGATTVPLSLLMELAFGPTGRALTTVAAVALSFVAINTYIAGGARLGAALGRDGALPRGLSRGAVPRRSLGVQAVMCAAAMTTTALFSIELDTLMRVTTVFLAAVSCMGMTAALRLLRRGSLLWYGALLAAVFTVLVLAFCGPLLALPAVVGLGSLLVPRNRLTQLARGPETGDPSRTAGRARRRRTGHPFRR
jgi:amino acid efflux transporter